MIGTVIGLIVIGLVAGFIARALVPGKQSMSALETILLGIVGSSSAAFSAACYSITATASSSRRAGSARSLAR